MNSRNKIVKLETILKIAGSCTALAALLAFAAGHHWKALAFAGAAAVCAIAARK